MTWHIVGVEPGDPIEVDAIDISGPAAVCPGSYVMVVEEREWVCEKVDCSELENDDTTWSITGSTSDSTCSTCRDVVMATYQLCVDKVE